MSGRSLRPLCEFFLRGRCRYGSTCRHRHERPGHACEVQHFDRTWTVRQAPLPGQSCWSFRLMSYNILADHLAHQHAPQLYPRVPRACLNWQHRLELIIRELRHFSPDILCLQEVDHFEDIQCRLEALGYEGRYIKRTGDRHDGCATFWRTAVLREVASSSIQYSEVGLKDNVAMIVLLEPLNQATDGSREGPSSSSSGWGTESSSDVSRGGWAEGTEVPLESTGRQAAGASILGQAGVDDTQIPRKRRRKQAVGAHGTADAAEPPPQLVMVGNTHVLFNTKRGDIKLGQLRRLLEEMQGMRAGYAERDVFTLVAGDFNSTPYSPIYTFMSTGYLSCALHDRRTLSGQMEGWGGRGPRLARTPMRQLVQQQLVSAQHAAVDPSLSLHEYLQQVSSAQHAAVDPSLSLQEYLQLPSAQHAAVHPPHSLHEYRAHLRMLYWEREELVNALGPDHPVHAPGQDGALVAAAAQHSLELHSSYAVCLGREPEFTSCHAQATDTVDFVWFTPEAGGSRMDVAAVLQTPQAAHFPHGMPTFSWPSDHVCLAVDYVVSRPLHTGAL